MNRRIIPIELRELGDVQVGEEVTLSYIHPHLTQTQYVEIRVVTPTNEPWIIDEQGEKQPNPIAGTCEYRRFEQVLWHGGASNERRMTWRRIR